MKQPKTLLISLATVLFSLLSISCSSDQNKTAPTFDFIVVNPGFPQPILEPANSLTGAPSLPKAAQRNISLIRAFFARDFVLLEDALNAAHQRNIEYGFDDEAERFFNSLGSSQLAGIDVCKDWLSAAPKSYAAHWVCGAMWHKGAWIARTGEYRDKVAPVRFALKRERMAQSNSLLEKAITLSEQPIEALVLLGSNHFSSGDREAGHSFLDQAEGMVPHYASLHDIRLNFSLHEWTDDEGAIENAFARAEEADLGKNWLLDFHDQYRARPWKFSDPGAERKYWERAIAQKSTFYRHKSLIKALQRVQNWRDSLPLAVELVESHPADAEGYWLLGRANEQLGKSNEALQKYLMAAAMGNNNAIQSLITAHIQGGLGVQPKRLDLLAEICRYGAAIGSPAALNCMGATFGEGDSVGGPFHTNMPQSLAWHLVAARAGYHNSQYDLGWLLLTGRGGLDVPKERGKEIGLFWLRRAAELDHQFAKKKLKERGYSESEEMPISWQSKVNQIVDGLALVITQVVLRY